MKDSKNERLDIKKINFKMGSKKISIDAVEQYFLIFIMIFVTDSTYWGYVWNDVDRKPVIILIILGLFVVIHRIKFEVGYGIYFIINIVVYGLSALVNAGGIFNDEAITGFLTIGTWVCLVIVIYSINKEYALTRYVKLVVAISVVSLFFYFFQQIVGIGFFESNFKVSTPRGLKGFFLYFAASKDMSRNYSMFGEPGVFQILLNTVLYIVFFWKDKLIFHGDKSKAIKFIIIIMVVCLFTARSALGFIVFGIMLMATISIKTKKRIKRLALLVSIIAVALFVEYLYSGETSILNEYLFEKMQDMEIGSGKAFNEYSSGGARLFVIKITMMIMKASPFFGVGSWVFENRYLTLSRLWRRGGTGNALFINVAERGLIPVLCTVVPIIFLAYRNKKNKLQYYIYIVMFFLIGIMQSQLIYAPLIFLALYDGNLNENNHMFAKVND